MVLKSVNIWLRFVQNVLIKACLAVTLSKMEAISDTVPRNYVNLSSFGIT